MSTRREFLKAIAAAPLATALPLLPVESYVAKPVEHVVKVYDPKTGELTNWVLIRTQPDDLE